jgi:transposase
MLINALRAHLAELGIATRLGPMGVKDAVALIEDADRHLIPEIVRRALSPLCDQLRGLESHKTRQPHQAQPNVSF